MKKRLLTFVGALTLLGVLGHFYAKPLLAQVRAALVQDVDSPARHFVQVYTLAHQPSGIVGGGLCSDLYTVPSGQRLVIDNIDVRTELANGGLVILRQTLTTSAAGCQSISFFSSRQPIVLIPPMYEGADTRGFPIYGNSQRVQVYADTARVVSLAIDTNGTFDSGTLFAISMSGHLVTFP